MPWPRVVAAFTDMFGANIYFEVDLQLMGWCGSEGKEDVITPNAVRGRTR